MPAVPIAAAGAALDLEAELVQLVGEFGAVGGADLAALNEPGA